MKPDYIEPEKSFFKYVYVDVTHKCQMSCANCYLPNRDIPDMDIDKLIECISKFPKKTDIRLVGGEPTLRPDLTQIIERIIKTGHRPIVITNGLKLSQKKYVQSLYDSGLRYIQLSMNGFDDNSIYLKTDQMNCAEQKMQALTNCDEVGINVSMSCILIRNLNQHLVPRFIEHAKKMKVQTRLNLRNVGEIGRNMRSDIVNFSLEEIVEAVSQATGISSEEILKHKASDNQIRMTFGTGKRADKLIIKLTDWSIYKESMDDKKRNVRGRITENFKVASFFEHVIANEFGY